MTVLRRDGADWLLACRVQPRARANGFAEVREAEVLIRLTAPPVDGKANAALCRFVAAAFGVAASRVTVEAGATSRHKRVRIAGGTVPETLRALGVEDT